MSPDAVLDQISIGPSAGPHLFLSFVIGGPRYFFEAKAQCLEIWFLATYMKAKAQWFLAVL